MKLNKKVFSKEAIVNGVKRVCEDKSNRKLAGQLLTLCVICVAANYSHAGTGGDEFDTIWVTLSEWMQGTLGRVVSGSMVLVGIVGGVIRQSVMAFATGVGGGIGLYNTPKVIEAIMTATLPHM